MKSNSSLGAFFAFVKILGRSQTASLVSHPKIFTNTKPPPQILELFYRQKTPSLRVSEASVAIQDSANAESNEIKSVRSTETRPLRGAKNRKQTSSSASADFLLEADKRGTPPKSEKRELLARRGSGAGGAALLRKDSSESKKQNDENLADSANHTKIAESSEKNTKNAESTPKSQNLNVDCFGDKSPRNDESNVISLLHCVSIRTTILLLCFLIFTHADEFTPNKNHAINIVSENDAYFEPFIKSDRYYTGGHFVSYLSPEFADSALNYIAGFSHLYDKHFTRFFLSLNQELHTPSKANYDSVVANDDLLFGAGLYANLSFVSRTRDFMEQFSIDLGVAGPLALGKETQSAIHALTNNRIYKGWDYRALKNEFLFNFHYGFIWRWVFIEDFFDVLPHFQISLGNARTAINAGAKFRLGYGIKNDFGLQKLHSKIAQNIAGDGLKVYVFFGASGSIVGRDMFIEGNSFGGAKSGVKLERFLYEAELGAMIGWKYVSLGYVWSNQSKRFRGQIRQHKYGSIRLEIMF
ncbi:lipid A deacylase LpxR family protein [Helicobacter sp. 23-1044]